MLSHLQVVSVKTLRMFVNLALNHLKLFGVKLDNERNLAARFGKEGVITTDDSAFKAMVIPTNEELVIAQDTAKLAL